MPIVGVCCQHGHCTLPIDYACILHSPTGSDGLLMDSCRLLMDSCRTPDELLQDSWWTPGGLLQDS